MTQVGNKTRKVQAKIEAKQKPGITKRSVSTLNQEIEGLLVRDKTIEIEINWLYRKIIGQTNVSKA